MVLFNTVGTSGFGVENWVKSIYCGMVLMTEVVGGG